jgi:hypothetical protein
VKNRTHYEGVAYEFISNYTSTTDTEVSEGVYSSDFGPAVYPFYKEGYARVIFDGVTYDHIYFIDGDGGNPNLYDDNGRMRNPEVPFAFDFGSHGYGNVYATTPGQHTIEFYEETSSIKQLDEKFIPDTIARVAEVDAKLTDAIAAIPQADWNQNDPEAADYVKNRTHYEDIQDVEYLLKDIPMSSMTSGAMGSANIAYPNGTAPTFESGKTYTLSFNGKTYTAVADSNSLQFNSISHPINNGANTFTVQLNASQVVIVGAYDVNFDWENSGLTMSVYSGTIDIKQLDEKFIPDTIARVAAVKAAYVVADNVLKNELNGEIAKKQDIIPENTYDAHGAAAQALADAKAYADGAEAEAVAAANANTAEVIKNYYTKSEADAAFMDATETGNAIDAKIAALNLAATYEPIGAETRAKSYADSLADNYATATQGTKADSALQAVEVGTGLKVSAKANNKQTIEIDDTVIFVFNCGDS